jgi:adenylate cyclase
LAESFNTMIEGLREKEMIQRTFDRHVDPDFARILLKQPEAGRLGGRRQEATILMADIRGFTPMTANLPPEATIEVLNGYFPAIIPLVQQYRGIIVDFVGDGILAFFDPIDEPLAETTNCCLQWAFDMHAAIDQRNREMTARHLPALSMGMGINSGPVVVGNIGSEARKKYGIVGAAVNITQRIQGQADAGEVVVSRSVFEMVESHVAVLRDFSAPLKGVTSAMQLYAVVPQTKTQP